MIMNKRTMAFAGGAVAAGALALGGRLGYEHLEGQVGPGHVLRGYDATSPAGTAPHAEDVFTGRVTEFEGRRDIGHWTTDVYRVDVMSVLRGDVHGTVRVTYAPDDETAQRLTDGATYVFATRPRQGSAVEDGHSLLFHGEMKPVDETQLTAWKEAVTLSAAPE
ncbi:hypothetical protein ACFT25_25390 [Streptomyces hydrogenans]|uniref:hypothetical protein n=1 Tax=Streptomyces hydrogenans TaxID=1873719 RepID=UPI0036332688